MQPEITNEPCTWSGTVAVDDDNSHEEACRQLQAARERIAYLEAALADHPATQRHEMCRAWGCGYGYGRRRRMNNDDGQDAAQMEHDVDMLLANPDGAEGPARKEANR